MTITTAQAKFITDLANKLLAKPVAAKPTFKKSWNGRKVSSNEPIEFGHRLAKEALDGLAVGSFGIDGRVSASQIIEGLKTALNRF